MTSAITATQLASLIDEGTAPFVVDVREAPELQDLPFNGVTALHVPLGQLPARLGSIPRDRPVYMLCRVGGRSAQAQTLLLQAGYTQVYNITGGVLAWVEAQKKRA